jgi:hypothetical protein
MTAFINIRTSCEFTSGTNGILDFTVGPPTLGRLTPADANGIDGHSYVYYAQSLDGSQWETGLGLYTVTTPPLTIKRGGIIATSNRDLNLVNFINQPVVALLPASSRSIENASTAVGIQPGTLMLFQQTAAPSGWTKQTTHNDKALRVVSGTASSGGSNAFSTVMGTTTTGNHTLSSAEIGSHSHAYVAPGGPAGPYGGAVCAPPCPNASNVAAGASSGAAGGGGAHNHPLTLAIQYVDLIIAQKN